MQEAPQNNPKPDIQPDSKTGKMINDFFGSIGWGRGDAFRSKAKHVLDTKDKPAERSQKSH